MDSPIGQHYVAATPLWKMQGLADQVVCTAEVKYKPTEVWLRETLRDCAVIKRPIGKLCSSPRKLQYPLNLRTNIGTPRSVRNEITHVHGSIVISIGKVSG